MALMIHQHQLMGAWVRSSGRVATVTDGVKLWTVSGVLPKVTVGATAPKVVPLMVSVGGFTAKFATALVITGWPKAVPAVIAISTASWIFVFCIAFSPVDW
jgi:hypothetical protein